MRFRYIFIIIILVLLLSVMFLLRSGLVSSIITPRVEALLESKLNIEIQIEGIYPSLLPPGVDIEKINIDIPEMGKFSADRASVTMGLWRFLIGEIYIKRLVVENPVCALKIPEDKKKNLDKTEGATFVPLPILLGDFRLKDGKVSLEIPSIGAGILIDRLFVTGGLDLKRMKFNTNMQLDGIALKKGDKNYSMSSIRGIMDFTMDSLNISVLEIGIEDSRFNLTGQVEEISTGNPKLNITADVNSDASLFHRYADFIPEMGGRIILNTSAHGRFRTLSYSGRVEFRQSRILELSFGDLESDFEGNLGGLKFSSTSIKTAQGKILAEGEIKFSKDAGLKCRASLKALSFARLLDGLTIGDSHVDSVLNGEVKISGSLSPLLLSGDVNISFSDFRIMENSYKVTPNQAIFRLREDAVLVSPVQIDGEKVRLSSARVQTGRSRIIADVLLGFNDFMRIDYTAEDFDLPLVFPVGGFNMKGRAMVSGVIEGPYENPLISGAVSVSDAGLLFLNLGNLDGKIEYHDKIMKLSDVQVYTDDMLLEGMGSINFEEETGMDMQVSANYIELGRLLWLLGATEETVENFAGTASGEIKLGGKADNIRGEITLELASPAIYGHEFSAGRALVRLADDRVIVDNLVLHGDTESILISGEGNYVEEQVSGKIALTDIPLQKLLRKSDLPLDGRLNGMLKLNLDRNGYSGDVELKVKRTVFSKTAQPDTDVRIRFNGWNMQITGNIIGGAGVIDANINLKEPYSYDVLFRFNELPLSDIAGYYLDINDPVGSITGSFRAEGNLSALKNSTALLNVTELKLGRKSLFLTNQEAIVVQFDRGRIIIPEFGLVGDNLVFYFSGERTATGINDFHAKGRVSLKLIDVLSNFVTLGTGMAEVHFSFTGPDNDLHSAGEISIDGGALAFRGFPQAFEGIETDITITSHNIFIDGLYARCGGGEIGITGGISMKNLRLRKMGLEAKIYRIYLPTLLIGTDEELPGTISGDILLSGPVISPTLSGKLTVNKATYSKNVNLQEKVVKIRTRKYIPREMKTEEFNLNMNLAIEIPDTIRVKNNLASLTIGGNLLILGSVPDIYIIGEIDLREGYIFFQADSFKITSGIVAFKDVTDIAPFFDISGMTEKEDESGQKYRITINISGRLEDIKISFFSDPTLSEKDIISLLRYGVKSDKIELAGATSSEAYSIGGSILIGELMKKEKVRELISRGIIDKVQFHPYTSERGRTTTLLTVSKTFRERLKLEYSTDVGGATQYMWASIEYSFGRYVSVLGSWNNETLNPTTNKFGNLGVDFSLHYEF